MGDVLFAAANVGRFLKIDTDDALRQSTAKFIRRFTAMEAMIAADGTPLRRHDALRDERLLESREEGLAPR